ncbi:hypothetical protein VTK56DRAFT_1827 [Thermocarpiscus australiensis]
MGRRSRSAASRWVYIITGPGYTWRCTLLLTRDLDPYSAKRHTVDLQGYTKVPYLGWTTTVGSGTLATCRRYKQLTLLWSRHCATHPRCFSLGVCLFCLLPALLPFSCALSLFNYLKARLCAPLGCHSFILCPHSHLLCVPVLFLGAEYQRPSTSLLSANVHRAKPPSHGVHSPISQLFTP